MKRSPMPPRTRPMRRKGATHAARRGHGALRNFPRDARHLIDRRDSDGTGALPVRLCQRCGTSQDPQRHHRRGKNKGGSRQRACTQCPCNGVTLCGPGGKGCHQWAHANPERARAEGWIVSQSAAKPGAVGVTRFAAADGGTTQWPTCSGEWAQTAPEAQNDGPPPPALAGPLDGLRGPVYRGVGQAAETPASHAVEKRAA